MVGYDLNDPGQDYSDLHEAIKDLGAWWHHLDSTWLVDTSKSTSEVRDELKQEMDSNDTLLVAKLSGGWSSWNVNESGTDWLHDHL